MTLRHRNCEVYSSAFHLLCDMGVSKSFCFVTTLNTIQYCYFSSSYSSVFWNRKTNILSNYQSTAYLHCLKHFSRYCVKLVKKMDEYIYTGLINQKLGFQLISPNIQGYPQRMRLQRRLYGFYTDCFLMFRIPCNCKFVYFFVKSLHKPLDNYI